MKRIFSRSAWSLMLLASVGFSMTGCSTVSQRVAGWIPNPKKDREIRFNLARLREQDGQLANARDEYLKLYEKTPEDARVCHRLGIVSARMGNQLEAQRYFELATKLEPKNAEIWTDFGYMLLQSEKYQEAESALNEALRMQPKNSRALSNLGLTYGYQDRMEESFTAFRKAGSDAEAHANIAYIYLQMGKPDLATRHFSRALTLDPSIKPAGQALIQLAEMSRQSGATNPADVISLAGNSNANSKNGKNEIDAKSHGNELKTTSKTELADLSVFDSLPPEEPQSKTTDVTEFEEKTTSVMPVNTSSSSAQKESDSAIQHAIDTNSNREEQSSKNHFAEDDLKTSKNELNSSRLVQLCPQARGEILQLVMGLETEDVQSLKRSIHKLGQMGTAAETAVPALVETLHHRDPYVQIHSALALWRIEQSADVVVPVLVVALGGDDAAVSTFAAAALGEIGSHSSDVLPALNRALFEQDGYHRLHIAEALGRSEQWKPHATRVLTDCLRDTDENVRWLATYSLADIGTSDPDVVQALMVALNDDQARVQAGAVWALERIGSASRPAIPQLKSLAAQSTDEDVQAAVKQCLSVIDENSRK
ncbi:MAG: HEAT repeat domain-containing protein [Planctomycetota bacterium]|nr:HEAT repeat domain-containing protein [Planctomycetota bacterium]MDA1213252.1 HEAT repeat domain-containing protein [Planctomycetota bacterium]